jgi:3-deoxy-D-manno-octulosonate 8-phosphate phosphatase (KDO 8-P phosphatase)
VQLLILDVDGVLTGGGIILGSRGMELKVFNTRDGQGIVLAHQAGLNVAIITARVSEAVEARAGDLGISDYLQGRKDKLQAYEHLLKKYHLVDEQVAYVGDDVLDVPVMKRVGLRVAVANASAELKGLADYVTLAEGGQGAVREVIDLLLGWKKEGGGDSH